MNKRRLIAIFLGVSAAGLLVSLILLTPLGSTKQVAAIVLFGASLLLYLLQVRADPDASRRLGHAKRELEKEIGELNQRLSESEAFSQSIIDGVPDPTIIINKDFSVAAINRAARAECAAGDDQQFCYRALHGRDGPCDPANHPCVLKTGESCKHIQVRDGEDGEEQLVELRATPLYSESGELTGAVEVLHRLNDQERLALKLRRAKEDAETAHRARAEFVATISHEVRTPMNAVLGMADLLRLTALTRKQKSYVQIMESSSNMLLSLVDNMIDFANLEAGDLVLKEEVFHATDLLERVLEIMGYQANSKGIEIAGATEHEPDMQVTGDFERLRQITINLVSNAIKFTDKGEVIVSVAVDSDSDRPATLTVSVSDSGIGMSDEAATRLFEPFTQITEPLESQAQGSGLGIAISKQLVELMGGEIKVESEFGRGTTVWFSVPVTRVADADKSVLEGRRALGNRRLLIVNDNPKVSAAICSFLEPWDIGCDVETRPDRVVGRLAAASDSGYPFDCVVIDVDTEQADRLDLARATRKAGDMPMILLTSIARPLKVGQISSIGKVRCVNKPVLPSELRHNLRRLLQVGVVESPLADDEFFRALRILVAEDNPINRRLLRGMLKSLDFEVDSVNDGPSVLFALRDKSYDLIMMDCQMPGMDGDEVTRIIREGKENSDGQPVVVAVTADVSANHREQCLHAGMDDFLAKPIRLDTLKSGLRRWSIMAESRRVQLPDAAAELQVESNDIIERLRERAGPVSGEIIDEYIDLFLDDTASRIDILRTALEQRDLDTMRRECHALKGACLELGVSRLGSCCDALGKASKDRRVDDLSPAMYRLTAEFDRVRPMFEAEKNRSV